MIKVEQVVKQYKIQRRREGFLGGIRDFISREYETKTAVDHISFDIAEGEMVGYIGPNGAGKSTTIKMLTGILKPTEGSIWIHGLVPYQDRKKNAMHMGVVFGQRSQLWWDIPVKDTLLLFKEMYEIPSKTFSKNIELFNDILGLDKFVNMPVRQLSLGQRMRADLACAMLHNPKILFLDEPTIGLDVVAKDNIREFIKIVNQEHRTTVLLTTHDMSDIEKLCSRVMVIDFGHIIYDGDLQALKKTYSLDCSLDILCRELPRALYKLELPGIQKVEAEGNQIRLRYHPEKINALQVIDLLREENEILDFKWKESDIESIIRNMYSSFSSCGGTNQ